MSVGTSVVCFNAENLPSLVGMVRNATEINRPLVLVDGHNLLWRAFYGFPRSVVSKEGEDRTGVFGFFGLLRVALRHLDGPVRCCICFDGQYASDVQRVQNPSYKAQREREEGPLLALPDIKRGLDSLGIPWVEDCYIEADDMIASIVRLARDMAIIVSTDKDFYQLLSEDTVILNTARRPGMRMISFQTVWDEWGISPQQWCDFRALMGDPADNVKGVQGIGKITAARLLRNGASIHELESLGRLKGRIGARVAENWRDVLGAKELMQLRGDVPFEIPPNGGDVERIPTPAQILEDLGLW